MSWHLVARGQGSCRVAYAMRGGTTHKLTLSPCQGCGWETCACPVYVMGTFQLLDRRRCCPPFLPSSFLELPCPGQARSRCPLPTPLTWHSVGCCWARSPGNIPDLCLGFLWLLAAATQPRARRPLFPLPRPRLHPGEPVSRGLRRGRWRLVCVGGAGCGGLVPTLTSPDGGPSFPTLLLCTL